jgi:hypothetical protein
VGFRDIHKFYSPELLKDLEGLRGGKHLLSCINSVFEGDKKGDKLPSPTRKEVQAVVGSEFVGHWWMQAYIIG